MSADDLPYVVHTVLANVRGSQFSWFPDDKSFNAAYAPTLRRVASRLLATSWVACPPEDPSLIQGFALAEPGHLCYVYVRKLFNNLGIASELLAGALGNKPAKCSHWSPVICGPVGRRLGLTYEPTRFR